MISVSGTIIQETAKAILFLYDHPNKKPVWLPKSQIMIEEGEWHDRVIIPKWLAEKHMIRAKPTLRQKEVNDYGYGLHDMQSSQ